MSSLDSLAGMTSTSVQVGRRHIHLSDIGSGYPVLMLHGGGPGASGLSNYSRNIASLARHFRVLVPDMPGYGRSSKGIDGADPFGDLASAMSGLLDALEIDSAHVIGNSYGGGCALRMALEQPSRTTSLVLMGPGGINTSRALPTAGLRKLLGYYTGSGPSRDKLREFIRDYLVFDGSQVPVDLIDKRYQDSIDPEVVANPPLRRPKGLGTLLKMDFTRDKRLSRCEVPTLVLWGAEDKVNRPSGGLTLQQRMPNCDLYLFSRTGHWVQWEKAEMFNRIVQGFLAQHTPG